MKISNFWNRQKKKFNNTVSNFHATLFTATINIIPIGNGPSGHCRPKHKGRLIHSTSGKETIFSIKHRNIYKHLMTGISYW